MCFVKEVGCNLQVSPKSEDEHNKFEGQLFGILNISLHSSPNDESQLIMSNFLSRLFKASYGYDFLNLIAPDPNSKIKSQGLAVLGRN